MTLDFRYAAALVAVLFGAIGCGGDDAPPAELRAASYNAGLAPGFVDFTEQRAPVTTAALAEHELDVLCVQEYFVPEHWEALVSASSHRYADTHDLEPIPDEPGDGDEEPACDEEETDPLVACIEENCPGASPDELSDCALNECEEEVDALSGECLSCVAANLGSTLEEIVQTCALGAGAYAYGGAFGIGILSRAPMNETDSIVMNSHLTRRGVLYGLVSDDDFGDVHVFCTHLSPVFSSVPFPGEGSWEQEQRDQIDALLGFVDDKVGEGEQVMVIGDLNVGPEAGGYAAEQPEHYASFEAAGFLNPYLDQDDPGCTFCATNLLVGGGADHEESKIIDHILLRGIDAAYSADRFMTERIEVEVSGETVETEYSDHYGVVVDLLK